MIPHSVSVLILAVVLDLVFGDPANSVHPVAGMGMLISQWRKFAPAGRLLPLLHGLALLIVGIVIASAVGVGVLWLCQHFPYSLALLAEAYVLKLTFSLSGLLGAGRKIQAALFADDLALARRLVSWHLVSRDTSTLTPNQLAGATIESLAENANDSFVAPLIFYACGGVSAALVYRFINTCDAMLGYHDARHEWLGKLPARLDDLANLLPARLTAAFLIAAGALLRNDMTRAVNIWCRDRTATLSPNAGQSMSAAAGVLGVELEKVGQYRLGRGLRDPASADIGRAIDLIRITALIAVIAIGSLLFAMSRQP